MNRRASLATLLFAMAGVTLASGYELKAYKGNVPLSETSLFYAYDDQTADFDHSIISKVDGEGTGFMGPARTSARVLPGTHRFLLKVIWDFSAKFRGPGITTTYKSFEMEVEVKDMRPLHVYVVRYRVEGEDLKLVIDDLGERATYGSSMFTRPAKF